MSEEEGRVLKQEADYTKDVDSALPQAASMAQAADMTSTSRILVHIVAMCFEQQAWDKMVDSIVMLIKRRGQLKKAVTDMIQKVCDFIQESPDKATKVKMLETVRNITAGKIHVENERARLTRELARIWEEDGDVSGAAEVLQELQVETYGTMERREKVEFILEQMRLCLAKKDFIRAQIISKKISPRFFKDEDTHDLKLKYHNQMLQLAANENSYLEMCKHYRSIYETPRVKEDKKAAQAAFESAVLHLMLAPYDSEQADLVARVSTDPMLEDMTEIKELLSVFTTNEITSWSSVESRFGQFLNHTSAFGNAVDGQKQLATLRDRIIEHNIRVITMYYNRMHTDRLAQLLELSQEEAEQYLSKLITLKTVYAKVDRPAQVVVFQPKPKAKDILNNWSHNVGELMTLVDKATHLIQKERMVHQV